MRSAILTGVLSLATVAQSVTVWQQRNITFDVPDYTLGLFPTNFTSKSEALSSLQSVLGSSKIAQNGDVRYGETIARVWTQQRKTWPERIVYPESASDVSVLMQFYSAAHSLWGDDGFAIMGGGHADFGGAQSPSVIVDLYPLSTTEIATSSSDNSSTNGNSSSYPILKVGGGADAGDVYDDLDGTGWAFLGPRAASIGVGGFLLGGGIAFQTNRYGIAVDNVVGLEVVLLNGTIVYVNPVRYDKPAFTLPTSEFRMDISFQSFISALILKRVVQ